MILSDKSIRTSLFEGRLLIDPKPEDWQIQPASVDLTLSADFMSPYDEAPLSLPSMYTILPGECVLGSTEQWIGVPEDMVARVEGKSSWGRRFIMCHSTAGFVDPGFQGRITLELVNLSQVSQTLPVGKPIAQISFEWVDQPVARPYGSMGLGSHYQGQDRVTPSALAWR